MSQSQEGNYTLVNVGTKESPVLVPKAVATADGSETERRWYDMLATGSVAVPSEVLSRLLGIGKKNDSRDS